MVASIEDTTIEDTTIEDTTSSVPLASLTELDVVSLLGALGLERYADACLAVPLRGADLVHCTEGDLAAAGVFFRPHRLSLLESLSGFATEGVPSTLLESAASPSSPSASLITGGDLPNWLAQAQAQLAAEDGQQPPLASEEHGGQQPPLLGLQVGSAAADVDPFPMGAASSGTMVLPKTTRGRGLASTGSDDQHDAALEVHYAPDRGSIRAVSGRSLGSLGAAPYLIGRGTTGVDLTLGEPHISARQATILPPSAHAPYGSGAPSALTPDDARVRDSEASWRLVDTSTNGTLVNGVPVGRNGCVNLRDGDVIHFGQRDKFPWAVFHQLDGARGASQSEPSWRCTSWEHANSSGYQPTPLASGARGQLDSIAEAAVEGNNMARQAGRQEASQPESMCNSSVDGPPSCVVA